MGDVTDPAAVGQAVRGCEAVVHSAERVARRCQEAGAPVVMTYPGAVYGPHDPHLGDGLRVLRNILKGRYPIAPSGGFVVVDVRDVAKVHAAVLEPGRGPAATWSATPSWGSPMSWPG